MPAKKTRAKFTKSPPKKEPAPEASLPKEEVPQPPTPQPRESEEPVSTAESDVTEALEQFSILDEESKLEQVNKVLFALGGIVTVIIITAAIVIGILYARSAQSQVPKTAETEQSVPTPTATPALVRSSVTWEVLNGSGVAGAAGKAAATLTGLGYTVTKTGNAEAVTKTSVLLLSREVAAWVPTIIGDMTAAFGISSASGELTGATVSARLIIGKQ